MLKARVICGRCATVRLTDSSEYVENASGAAAPAEGCPQGRCDPGQIIDCLSHLPDIDWTKLNSVMDVQGLGIGALELPTSHQGMPGTQVVEFTSRKLAAISSIQVKVLVAIANTDHEQRREQ